MPRLGAVGRALGIVRHGSPRFGQASRYSLGLNRSQYSGWPNQNGANPTWFDGKTAVATVVVTDFDLTLTAGETSRGYQWVGYFKPDYTGTWTITTNGASIDDGMAVWIGDRALSGYTTGNAVFTATDASGSGTVSLTAGTYYPIRVQYDNNSGPGSSTLYFSHTGQAATKVWNGKLFYLANDTAFNTFTLTETIDTNGASIVATNVGPLTIEAKATSFQVNPVETGYIKVNGTTIKTTTDGSRGHTLAVITPAGAVVGTIDVYDTFGDSATLTTLATALGAVTTGNYIVLVTWDACAVDAGVRSALTTGYGATLTTTWAPTRYSHIFIGRKA